MTRDAKSTPCIDVLRGTAPLLLSIPHAGTALPVELANQFSSPWLATKDADWHVDRLYSLVAPADITVIQTHLSRSAIDVNRDPSGKSLYPGMTTTELCPTATFDGEALYHAGREPNAAEIAARRTAYFEPYHTALRTELDRLRARHSRVVLFDAHSIRSVVPRLFDGQLPVLNFGTNSGNSCAPSLAERLHAIASASPFSCVCDGRFKGGYITRHYGVPAKEIHAVQLELACRAYLQEPVGPVDATNWPVQFNAQFAEPLIMVLRQLLTACIDFAAAP